MYRVLERWDKIVIAEGSSRDFNIRVNYFLGFSDAEEAKQSSQAMNRLGDFVKSVLTKFWIWVVAIMLFVIGLSGTRMTVYRIIYMALFLIFVLVFQVSSWMLHQVCVFIYKEKL
jgi:hypothetical protein